MADYCRDRPAKTILLANVRVGRSEGLGILRSHVELNHRVLLKLGVPEDAMEAFVHASSSTAEEGVGLRRWAERGSVNSIIVPTEIFSAHRLRWVLKRAFAGSGIRVQVPALNASEYTRRPVAA